MFRRWHMAEEPDILRPGEFRRVERAADDEAPFREAPRRRDEQPFQYRLPVRRIGAEIRKVRAQAFLRWHWMMRFRVHAAIEGCDTSRAEFGPQAQQRCPTGIAQHQVEAA